MIKELMFEGSNRYFDQALCTGLNITEKDSIRFFVPGWMLRMKILMPFAKP